MTQCLVITKVLFLNFFNSDIIYFAKVIVRYIESLQYLTGQHN